MEVIKSTLKHLTNRNKLLLEERSQEIGIARIMCPDNDPDNQHWKRVEELSREINDLKKEMAAEENKKLIELSNTAGKKMAERFLESVTATEVDIESESVKKRKFNVKVDCATEVVNSPLPSKKPTNSDKDTSSITLRDSSALSILTTSNSVS